MRRGEVVMIERRSLMRGLTRWPGSVRASAPHTSPAAAFEEAPVLDPSPGRSRLGAAALTLGRGTPIKSIHRRCVFLLCTLPIALGVVAGPARARHPGRSGSALRD